MGKLALVLSGGGAKGAYQVGVLREVLRRQLPIHLICGTSIGALNGAVLAQDLEEETGGKYVEKLAKSWLEAPQPIGFHWWGLVKTLLRGRSPLAMGSLSSDRRVRRLVGQLIPKELQFDHFTKVELAITATDLNRGTSRVFTNNDTLSLRRGVLASCALPLLLPTVTVDGRYHTDGGVFANTPIGAAMERGATEIIVVSLRPQANDIYLQGIADGEPYDDLSSVATRLVDLILDQVMYREVHQARIHNALLQLAGKVEGKVGQEIRRILGVAPGVIGYTRLIEIAPETVLEPPGAFGFNDKESIAQIMKRGEEDARQTLAHLSPPMFNL
ncbi:MAG: patatin-like phospholipase family protein [Limnochordia bacterium]|jgi:predicted acylesterase/phospholipase RssA